ncbi:MAG: hypothetical protein GY851_21545 [bacterium]|nr:hypothetical protein [bacterium]
MKLRIVACLLVAGMAWSVGAAAVETLTNGADPVVSPNGKSVAFVSRNSGAYEVYVMTLGNKNIKPLAPGGKDDRNPCWSPDGKSIIFDSRRGGGKGDLFKVALGDPGSLEQITMEKAEISRPSFTADGKGLLYARSAKKGAFGVGRQIVYAADASNPSDVTVLAEGSHARMSPDGSKVVYMVGKMNKSEIWIMNADGSDQAQLTSSPGPDENPCFSPDGSKILWSGKRGQFYDLYTMDLDGGNIEAVTSTPGFGEKTPSWAKDGYIYFLQRQGPVMSNICRMKAPK